MFGLYATFAKEKVEGEYKENKVVRKSKAGVYVGQNPLKTDCET